MALSQELLAVVVALTAVESEGDWEVRATMGEVLPAVNALSIVEVLAAVGRILPVEILAVERRQVSSLEGWVLHRML